MTRADIIKPRRPWNITPKRIRSLVIDGLLDDAALVREGMHAAIPDRKERDAIADGYLALHEVARVAEDAGRAWQLARFARTRVEDSYDPSPWCAP